MNLQDYTKAVDTYADSVYRVAYSYTYRDLAFSVEMSKKEGK